MSCERIQQRLSEYLDGGLAGAARAEVEIHLRGCLPCRRLARDLERLADRVRGWDPERRPERDLWPHIAARLEPAAASAPPRGRPLRRWVLAAAAVLAIGVAVPVAVDWLAESDDSPAARARRQRDRQAYEALVAAASVARVADGTLQPRRDLESLVAEKRGRLEPRTVDTLEAEMDRLQRAIGEISLALEDHPDDRRLRLLLAARYRQESELLHRLGRV